MRDDLELSAKLQHLGFFSEVVSIIEAGEKTGRLSVAIKAALVYLKQNIEISGKNSKQLTFGIVLIVSSLSLFFSLPLLLAEPINMLHNLRDIQINLTPATYVLLFVKVVVSDYWWLLCVGIGAISFLGWRFRYSLSQIPPFTVFGDLEKTKRAIHFLIMWRAFRVANIPLEEQVQILRSALGARASAYMIRRLERGESLTDTLSTTFFSSTLVLAIQGLSQVDAKTFLDIVDMLLASLHEERQAKASRVATTMYALGAVFTIATVMLLAFGLIFPIMGASAGLS